MATLDLSDLADFVISQARWNALVLERTALITSGNALLNALLAVQPSTMDPRVVQDAMHSWLDAIGVPRMEDVG